MPILLLSGALLSTAIILVLLFPPRILLRWLEARYPGLIFSFDPQRSRNHVALTIDDAPSLHTPAILELLARHNVRATFFCIGEQAARYPHILRQIVDAGHELANHDRVDRRSALVPTSQLMQDIAWTEEQILKAATSDATKQQRHPLISFFRPGAGTWTAAMIAGIKQRFGYQAVLSDCYSFDPQLPFARFIYHHMRMRVQSGSILLLHDGSVARARVTCEVLERLLLDCKERRKLSFATLSEMAAIAGEGKKSDSINAKSL